MKTTNNKLAKVILATLIASTTLASATTVKIMYAYTKDVKDSFGGTSQIQTLIQVKEALNQEIFDNSTTKVSLVTTSHFEATYNTTDDSERQITRLGKSTSQMKDTLDAREDDNADLVQLFCVLEEGGSQNTLDYGIAQSGGWASVVDGYLLAVTSNPLTYVSAHEISHNFTASHDEAYELSDGTLTVTSAGGTSTSRVPYFSSSSKTTASGAKLGTSSYNNRSNIRQYRRTVKAFN